MDAIFWTSQGLGRGEVSLQSGVHRNSVKNYIKLYNKGGLNALITFGFKGFNSILMKHRVTLEEYIEKHPPRTA